MANRFVKYILLLILGFVIHWSCKKETVTGTETPLPSNPYDNISYPINQIPTINIDSNSFAGIHKYIFSTKCSVPGCHDGAFEPDFRTITSSYNNLVLQPVFKNDSLQSFVYRVKPYDITKSWLHERLVTNNAVLGRMPLYDNPLSNIQMQRIRNWINAGAPDALNNLPAQSNAEPQAYGIVATIATANGNIRVDSIRNGNPFMPFLVPNNSILTLWIGLYDDVEIPSQFTYNKIKFSTHPTDFTNSAFQNLMVNAAPTFFSNYFKTNAPYFTSITINTNTLPNNQVVYFRTYIKDSNHTNITELPNSGNEFYQLNYYSFIVAP